MSDFVSLKITSRSQKPKFGQLVLSKIIKIVATKCQILSGKMHQNQFRLGQRLPRLPSWNKGDLLLREGEECREEKKSRWEGSVRDERGGDEKEGRGRKGDPRRIFKFSLEQPTLYVYKYVYM